MKKIVKIVKITLITLLSVFFVMILGLFIYTRDSYGPLEHMYDEISLLNLEDIKVVDDIDQISYFVDQPKKNIIIIPGGKVKPESYAYLASMLALEGYDVTIVKTIFNLAILTPNYGSKFLKDGIDNVVIGHSLGGTVASMFSVHTNQVKDMIFLASYPIHDVSDKRVLVITGQYDLILVKKDLSESEDLLPTDRIVYEIIGGNHAQFGWYGEQKDDGTSSITTKEQQDIVVNQIIDFIR